MGTEAAGKEFTPERARLFEATGGPDGMCD